MYGLVTHKWLRLCRLITHKGLKVYWLVTHKWLRVCRLVTHDRFCESDWQKTVVESASPGQGGDWVPPGSTLTALDGRMETTILTPNWTMFISDSGFNLCAEKHVVCQSCAVALKSID